METAVSVLDLLRLKLCTRIPLSRSTYIPKQLIGLVILSMYDCCWLCFSQKKKCSLHGLYDHTHKRLMTSPFFMCSVFQIFLYACRHQFLELLVMTDVLHWTSSLIYVMEKYKASMCSTILSFLVLFSPMLFSYAVNMVYKYGLLLIQKQNTIHQRYTIM